MNSRLSLAAEYAQFRSYDYRDGKKEAEQAIAMGKPKWKIYGLYRDSDARAAVLKDKLGVELDWFAGCVTSEGIHKYARDYNEVMRSYLVSKFGETAVYGVLGDPPKSEPDANEKAGLTRR